MKTNLLSFNLFPYNVTIFIVAFLLQTKENFPMIDKI